jgi:hypothetical protein
LAGPPILFGHRLICALGDERHVVFLLHDVR